MTTTASRIQIQPGVNHPGHPEPRHLEFEHLILADGDYEVTVTVYDATRVVVWLDGAPLANQQAYRRPLARWLWTADLYALTAGQVLGVESDAQAGTLLTVTLREYER